MRIAVTGASGLIGSALLEYWKDRIDLSVTALTRSLSSCPVHLKEMPNVFWFQGDLSSPADCDALVHKQDVIVHLAHTNAPLTSDRDMASDAELNLVPTLRLIKAIQKTGRCLHLIYPSSGGAVYGRSNDHSPFAEDHPCVPINSYGIQKMAAENYIRLSAERAGLRATVLRISNVYGWLVPPERKQGLIGTAIFQALLHRSVRLLGDPENVRDYIHIDDLCRAVDQSLNFQGKFRILNIGTGIGYTVREVLNIIQQELGRELDFTQEEWQEASYLADWCVLDISRSRNELNWVPIVNLREGVRKMLDFSSKHLESK